MTSALPVIRRSMSETCQRQNQFCECHKLTFRLIDAIQCFVCFGRHSAVTRSAARVPVRHAANLRCGGRPVGHATHTTEGELCNLVVRRRRSTAGVLSHFPLTSGVRSDDVSYLFHDSATFLLF